MGPRRDIEEAVVNVKKKADCGGGPAVKVGSPGVAKNGAAAVVDERNAATPDGEEGEGVDCEQN